VVKLTQSDVWNRKIRQDELADLGVPTATLAAEAVKAGRTDEALELIEYGTFEAKKMHDASVTVIDDLLGYLARRFGEGEIERFWRESFTPRIAARMALNLTLEQQVHRFAEDHRGHGADLEVIEERDRYVLKLNTCGSGTMLRKTRPDLGATKEAYPWSWGRSGVPYYCTHCCIAFEIVATERQGYPARIHECPRKADEPCLNFVYKKPELIPQEYFTRVGMKKDRTVAIAAARADAPRR
jgi:hypothetical protein